MTSDDASPSLIQAIQDNDDSLKSIIQNAKERGLTEGESRDLALVTSGFAHGWNQREGYNAPRLPGDRAVVLLRESVAQFDTFLLTAEPNEALTAHRNAVADYLMTQQEEATKRARDGLASVYGPRVADLCMRGGEYTEEEQFFLGHKVSAISIVAFYGFCLYRNDDSIKCKCPFHFAEALREKSVNQEDAEKAVTDAFPSLYAALCAFGNWFASEAVSKVRETLIGDTVDMHPINLEEAARESQGMFSRLMGRTGGA